MRRPVRITLIAWFSIVLGTLILFSVLAGLWFLASGNELYHQLLERDLLSSWLQLAGGFVSGSIFLITGCYMLKARYWAWLTLLILLGLQVLFYLATNPYFSRESWLLASLQLAFYGVYFYLLLSTPARRYFTQTTTD